MRVRVGAFSSIELWQFSTPQLIYLLSWTLILRQCQRIAYQSVTRRTTADRFLVLALCFRIFTHIHCAALTKSLFYLHYSTMRYDSSDCWSAVLLADEALLRQVLTYVGPMQYRFVAPVNRQWKRVYDDLHYGAITTSIDCLLYTSPSPRD